MYNDQIQKFRRQKLRKNQTEAEKILWEKVRNRKLSDLKFYRQYSIGPYILDFFCPKTRVGIELDGEQHKEAKEYDKEREFFLEKAGVHIIRFWNQEIINNLEGVLKNITNSNARNPSLAIREGPSEAKSG